MTAQAKDFVNLDRDARLNILREVQHHSGIESEEYLKLARTHEWALNRTDNVTLRRPIK
jgi:hypothetical protein